MLISRVEEEDGLVKGQDVTENSGEDSHDYQTASELFELMAKKHNFQPNETDSLTTRDLILLYKNIDLGTKLMSSANDSKSNAPNQYVETIVYHEDSDSELSEICSSEDLHNVMLINNERLDLIDNSPSTYGNTLCHKFGNLEILSSKLPKEYGKSFIFKDHFSNLQSLDLMTSKTFDNTVLPTSILDCIGCKQLEDYNFYMDSVIRYVTNTIDHLKRISDGEYLTDKAKEKWKEVNREIKDSYPNTSIVLSNSVNIPLQQNRIANTNTWDDIIHSEVNIRSLSKILEKKIIVEVPKTICDSFQFFTKCINNDLVIKCKKDPKPVFGREDKERESRVDVVLQLKHSKTGQVMSKISSITILQKKLDNERTEVLPLPCENSSTQHVVVSKHNVEIHKIDEELIPDIDSENNNIEETALQGDENANKKTLDDTVTISSADRSVDGGSELDETTDYASSPTEHFSGYHESSESSCFGIVNKRHSRYKAAVLKASSDDLKLTIQRLSTQGSLPEESLDDITCGFNKKKSPTRNRMKSPYENKSHVIEERKRKRLLEIRQRREKRKLAMTEAYKATKARHGKGFVTTQPSSSVTKLSITNKSFYNSIYGQTSNEKLPKLKLRKQKQDSFEETSDVENENENEDEQPTPELNSQKYINKNYFLDDTVSEMMYIEMKQKESEGQNLRSNSLVSNDFDTKLDILNQLIAPSMADLNSLPLNSPAEPFEGLEEPDDEKRSTSCLQKTPMDASEKLPKNIKFQLENDVDPKKTTQSSMEFRKSIDKIYELMNKLGKGPDNKLCKSKFTAVQTGNISRQPSPVVQFNESSTSLKDHPPTNPSAIDMEKAESVEKPANQDAAKLKNTNPKSTQATVVPKVVISSKSQTPKGDGEKARKDRNKKASPTKPTSENPLKAISQLLHEFDNVQKTRNKTVTIDTKPKKPEVVSAEVKVVSRQNSVKKSFGDSRTSSAARERKSRPVHDHKPVQQQQPPVDDKQISRVMKKQVADLVDEFKEARGEAVRGPRPSARLNSLAQPKRTYVQAQIEDFQARYGKSLVSDRLLRLSGTPAAENLLRPRIKKIELTGLTKHPSAPPAPSERTLKAKAFTSSREMKSPQTANEQSLKQHNVSEPSGTLTKKMVAVESYVKHHYGRHAALADNNEQLRGVQKTRVPHLPTDFKLSPTTSLSEENSFFLGGDKYDSVDNLTPGQTGLAVLTELNETTSEHSKDNNDEIDELMLDAYVKNSFDKKSSTTDTSNTEDTVVDDSSSKEHNPPKFLVNDSENHIDNQLYVPPVCTIQNRLKIKNFSMPPKEQMQKIYNLVLKASDSKSMLVDSSISQRLPAIKSKSKIMKDMKKLAGFTKIGFDFPQFPMPIATVGYCFPQYHSAPCNSKTSLIPIDNSNGTAEKPSLCTDENTDKLDQHFKTTARAGDVSEQAMQTEEKLLNNLPAASKISNDTKSNGVTQPNLNCEIVELQANRLEKSSINAEEKKSENVYDHVILTPNNSVKTISNSPSAELRNLEYTTSLDILVGLLSEIQKITTCQTQITNPINSSKECLMNFDNILKESSIEFGQKSLQKKISITSIEKLRQLDSKASICSFYLSNGDMDSMIKPIYVDKQVSAEPPRTELKNTFTDVPSRFFPTSVNHATSNTFLGVLSEPSTPSMFSIGEHALHSNASLTSLKKIIELPHITEIKVEPRPKALKKTLKKITINSYDKELIAISTTRKIANSSYYMDSEFDPIMKMKRDILVTMYSVLVFTVFAALSFPEILYRA